MHCDRSFTSVSFNRADIESLIPHRGEILFLQQMTIHNNSYYTGVAHWHVERMGLRGHFPQQSVVPAVFLVEAIAQLGGAGVVATRAIGQGTQSPMVGVMMAIRRCAFRQIVHVGHDVQLEVRTRRMGDQAVMCEGIVTMDGQTMAEIEVLIGAVPEEMIKLNKEGIE